MPFGGAGVRMAVAAASAAGLLQQGLLRHTVLLERLLARQQK